jgi:hypothetical protein
LSFPKGSAENILSSYNIPHLSAFVTSGAIDWNDPNFAGTVLGYVAEIWLATAAKEQGTDIDDPVSFTASQSIAVTKHDLKQLLIDFSAPPKGGFSEGQTRPTGDYGYCQFLYAQGAVPPIHISFAKTKLCPPLPNCTGANLWFREKLSGSYVTIYNSVAAPQVVCDASHPVSPSTNAMSGTGFGVELSHANGQEDIGGTITIPTAIAGGFSTWVGAQSAILDLTTMFGSGPFRTAPLAFLCEAWQDIVQPTLGPPGGPYPIAAGESLNEATLAWMKSGSLVVTPPGGSRSELKWRFGMPIYGSWAPMYGDYCGPMHALNLISNFLIPDYRDCTGFWIFLKAGCSASLSSNEAANWSQGTSNANGSVNLVQGITDGLIWDV